MPATAMEPPSAQLVSRLQRLGLCTRRDFRACYPIVRRLSRDLPTFDSVWIDALRQRKRLTHYQANVLEVSDGASLRIGPCLVQDPMDRRQGCHTFRARHVTSNEACVLKRFAEGNVGSIAEQRLKALPTQLRKVTHPGICGPHAWLETESGVVTVSRQVKGRTLKELLIRRGRLPARIVVEIAGQLFGALAELEKAGVTHGDICLDNIRLTKDGQATLVDAGVRTAVESTVAFADDLVVDKIDAVAPELIGTGRTPDAVSDMYSFGCVLWHLATGRPPHTSADPLNKLAAHRTVDIADVRLWATELPEWFARLLLQCTRRDRDERPTSFAKVVQNWPTTNGGPRQLARFSSGFQRPAQSQRIVARNWPSIVAVGMVAALIGTWWFGDGKHHLLALAGRSSDQSQQVADSVEDRLSGAAEVHKVAMDEKVASESVAAAVPGESRGPVHQGPTPAEARRLPEADANGVIRLEHAGRWLARDISRDGPVEIVGPGRGVAVVQITDQPMRVAASEVAVDGIYFQVAAEVSAAKVPFLAVNSRRLRVEGCRFETPVGTQRTAIWWAGRGGDSSTSHILMNDTVFANSAVALLMKRPPDQIRAANVFKSGAGAFLQMLGPARDSTVADVSLERVTLRKSGPLAQLNLVASQESAGHLRLTANDCVFDLAETRSGQSPLFVVSSESLPTVSRLIELRQGPQGDTNLASLNLVEGWLRDPQTGLARLLPASVVRVAGTIGAEFRFAGADLRDALASEVVDFSEVPRLTPDPPGIVARRMLGDGEPARN